MNIYDIAKLSGVSIATVSRVLNNKPGVSESARNKVIQVIEETKFVPNQLAISLANQKSYVIGIVMPGINHYFSRRVDAINRVCKELGYSIMITANYKHSNSTKDDLENFNLLIEKRVDGIIYFPTHVSGAHIELIERIKNQIPIVITDSNIEQLKLPCVIQDSVKPTKDIMEYLLNGGHKDIGFINGISYDQVNKLRFDAYKDCLESRGLSVDESFIEIGDYSLQSGYEAMKRLLAKTVKNEKCQLTAVFAANDNMAMGAIRAIKDEGLEVPDNISVIGYDGIEFGQYYSPQLTTVRVDQYKLGKLAADMIIELIESHHVRQDHIVMDYEIVYGESSRKLND